MLVGAAALFEALFGAEPFLLRCRPLFIDIEGLIILRLYKRVGPATDERKK